MHTQEDIRRFVDSIIEPLSHSLAGIAGPISGARLSVLILQLNPTIKFKQLGGFSKFVDTYLSHIVLRERKINGTDGDDLYKIVSNEPGSLWQTFASPNSPQSIFLLANDRFYRLTIGHPEDPPPGGVELKSATHGELHRIAEDFLQEKQLESPELATVLESKPFAYANWTETLTRVGGRGLYSDWGIFRVGKLEGLFLNRLSQANVPAEQADELVATLKSSYRRKDIPAPIVAPQLGHARQGTLRKEVDSKRDRESHSITKRELARLIVAGLSDEDLRNMTVRLGSVFDALNIRI